MSRPERYFMRRLGDTQEERLGQARFLAEAWPDNPLAGDAARGEWQYGGNPDGTGRPTVWVFGEGSRILGQLGAIPVTVRAGGKAYAAAWCVDFVVHPEFRNRGVAPLLLREATSAFDLLLALGTNDLSYPLFKKAGWRDLGHLPHFVKVLDMRAWLARVLPPRMLGVVAAAGNVLLRAWDCGGPSSPGIRVSEFACFGPEFDELWERVSPAYAFLVRRDAEYLNWRYVRHPGMRYVALRADGRGGLRGYAVVRKTRDKFVPYGVIADLLADPEDEVVIDALLRAGVHHLRGRGATFVRCYASHPRFRAALRRLGFVERRSSHRFMFSVRADRPGLEGAERLEEWFLMKGDSDIDRIPLPEDA